MSRSVFVTFSVIAIIILTVPVYGWLYPGITHQKDEQPLQQGAALFDISETGKKARNQQFKSPDLVPIDFEYQRSSRDTVITFPDGTEVNIKLINWQPDPPPFYPTEKLIDMYDALVAEAEIGNAAAARTLYEALTICEMAFSDEASYQEALSLLRQKGVRSYPGDQHAQENIPPGLDTSHHEEMITEQYIKCQGITTRQKQNKIQWAEMAAHGGDFLAMRTMANEQGFTQEGFEWYEKGWKSGHASAADALSIWYRNGAPDSAGGKPDYISSYAYLLINFKIYENVFNSSNSPQAQNRIVDMENALLGIGGYLNPQDQVKAEELAVKLLQDNSNCCLGGWAAFGQ